MTDLVFAPKILFFGLFPLCWIYLRARAKNWPMPWAMLSMYAVGLSATVGLFNFTIQEHYAPWLLDHVPQRLQASVHSIMYRGAAQSAVVTLAAVLFFDWLNYKRARVVLECLAVFAAINGCYTAIQGHGMMNAHSFDSAFGCLMIVATLSLKLWPSYQGFSRWFFLLLMLLPTLVYGGLTGLLMLCAASVPLLVYTRAGLILIAGLSALLGVLVQFDFFRRFVYYESIVRFRSVTTYVGEVIEKGDWLFGALPGSFEMLGMFIKVEGQGGVMFAHNDFAQVFFEYGLIGFLLLIIATAHMLMHTRKSPQKLALVLSLLVFACFYFPLHIAQSQVAALCIVRLCYWPVAASRVK